MQEQFALIKERAVVAHLNTRTELHGEDEVPACDVKLEFSLHNSVLNKLHPELQDVFYKAEKQMDIEADHKANLRFPLMSAFSWAYEIPRAELTIHDLETGSTETFLGKANKLKLELLEGGTTKLTLRFQMGEIDPQDAARLFALLRQTVTVSLGHQGEEEKQDNFAQADLLSKGEPSEARKEAESMFDKAPATDLSFTAETENS